MKILIKKVIIISVALLFCNLIISQCCVLNCNDVNKCESIKLFKSQNSLTDPEPQEYDYIILEDSNGSLDTIRNKCASDQYHRPECYGAIGDGITDDSQAIQDAVDAGGTVMFDGDRRYKAFGIQLNDNSTIDLNGATIIQAESFSAEFQGIFIVDEKDNVTIRNGRIIGDGVCQRINNNRFAAIFTVRSDKIRIESIDFDNIGGHPIFSVRTKNSIIDDIIIENSVTGLKLVFWETSSISNVIVDGIDNNGCEIFQHANDFIEVNNSNIHSIIVKNQDGDTAGRSGFASGITSIDCKNSVFSNWVITDMISDELFHLGISIVGGNNLSCTQFTVTGVTKQAIEFVGTHNSFLDGFFIDMEYRESGVTDDTGNTGLIAHLSGFFPLQGVFPNFSRPAGKPLRVSSKLSFSNGIVQRCNIGVRVRGKEIDFENVKSIGNLSDGFRLNNESTVDEINDIHLSDCHAKFNGRNGVTVSNGASIKIDGGIYSNNGQIETNPLFSAGIGSIANDSIKSITITDVNAQDNQSKIKTITSVIPCNSFSMNDLNCYKITLDDIDDICVGQHIGGVRVANISNDTITMLGPALPLGGALNITATQHHGVIFTDPRTIDIYINDVVGGGNITQDQDVNVAELLTGSRTIISNTIVAGTKSH